MTPYDLIDSESKNAPSLEAAAVALEQLLSGGFAVWEDGSLYSTKQLVDRVKGLTIEVHPREHPPPHFHISGGGIDATFSIVDGSLINGVVGPRQLDLVQWWYKRSRDLLVRTWNQSRPTDCPVGPVLE